MPDKRKKNMFQNLDSSDIVSKLASATGGGALLGLALLDVLPGRLFFLFEIFQLLKLFPEIL